MTALIIILVLLGALGYWRVSLRLWPNAACRKCNRGGKNAGSNSKRWGSCRKCGGSGKRTRVGARS
jgi:hypothetical protein